MTDKPIRMWRMRDAEDQIGMYIWFDPTSEAVSLRDLTEGEKCVILDNDVSVSGMFADDHFGAVSKILADARRDQLPLEFPCVSEEVT